MMREFDGICYSIEKLADGSSVVDKVTDLSRRKPGCDSPWGSLGFTRLQPFQNIDSRDLVLLILFL